MAIITVTTLDDTAVAPDGEVSLREALAAANGDTSVDGSTTGSGDDTIVFNAALAGGTLVLTNGELSISTNLAIDGDVAGDDVADITVDGDGNSRVFNVTAGTSTLDALVITGGDASSTGGGVQIALGAAVTVTNSLLFGNSASAGGGVWNGGTAILTNTSVAANNAVINGGGILSTGTVTLTNTTVSGNDAGASGGGILNTGAATLVNTTLSGNAADKGGGMFHNNGTALLTSTTLSGNFASSGGGIYNAASATALTLTNTILLGNESPGLGPELYGSATYAGVNIAGLGGDTDPTGDHVINASSLDAVFDEVGFNPHTGVFSGVLGDNLGPVEIVDEVEAVGGDQLARREPTTPTSTR